ncbi:MAG: transposase family protein, partial [Planctomycetaceae bacterium]|nr:transposase family protein [Planctomycetaceae bacterium]
MVSLPADRVTPSKPPFSHVGVDCFGPFEVKRGRSIVKRYGVLFTCLTKRAIHIEVANSLDTVSFINALRRFISRRGQPELIRSDNGGNFVKGERELRIAVEEWNQAQIHNFLLQKNVKWIFNPPAGSHFGGVWERCIRSVRKVMKALMHEQTLDDESLTTLMCEVEAIVNGRPITKLSDDPNDSEPLTPNHLLLLRNGPAVPPGKFKKDDNYSHRRWRQVQYLANVFWRRWIKEYLPSLQQRQKWNNEQINLAENDIVLVLDERTPRSSWPLGRVVEVHTNRRDG